MQYNNFCGNFLRVIVLVITTFVVGSPLHAQQLESKTLARNIAKFKQYRQSDVQRAYDYAVDVLSDVDSLAVSQDIAMVCDFMAEYSEGTLHRYTDALNYRKRACAIYEELVDEACVARTNALLARIYLRNNDYHHAFSCGIKALEDARSLGDSTTVREAYLALEQVDYFYHKDTLRAMDYNRRVSESYDGRAQAHQMVRALNNRFHYDLSPDELNVVIERCETVCREYGFNDLLVNVYLNAAMQEFMFEDFEATARYLDMAKPMISNFKEEGYYYSARGFYHLNMGDNSQAISDLKRSIELLGNGDFDTKNVHSYFLLQDIYYRQGRYREAYDALMSFAETYTHQHNTQNIVELSLLVSDMELRHAEQEHQRREERHQQELEIHKREQEHSRMVTKLYVASVVVILILGVLLYSRYRLERKNRDLQRAKAEQDINYRNEIIKIQKLQQFQEQNNIDKIVEELNQAMNIADNKVMRGELRRIVRQLCNDVSGGGDWAEVEKTLADGNNLFYENLLKEYPNLTKNERKLCLFIHMNMSTKEISAITNQSVGSINVARSRLRQKFGLTGDDKSLISYLDRFDTTDK
jgi:tetratricopeptide (TPR) repeat protein